MNKAAFSITSISEESINDRTNSFEKLQTIIFNIKTYTITIFKTLSKILCKWKQDSVVSLFLYLNSVFKHKHKLIHNQAPVMNRLCPFLLNLHK